MKCKIKDALMSKINECFEEYSSEFELKKDIEKLDELLGNYSGNALTEYDYEILNNYEENIRNKYNISRILTYLNRYYGPLNQGNFNACFSKSKRLISTLELEKIALFLKCGMDNKLIEKPSDGVEEY